MAEKEYKGCSLCDKGWLYEYEGEEWIPKPCKCLVKERLREYIQFPEIYNAERVKSELYHRESEETEVIDRTQDNLFLRGTWEVVCQHLRWVLSAKYLHSPGFKFKIIDDDFLIRVWLGHEGYLHQPKAIRDTIETYNNLLELMPHPDLMIIRLGIIERRNKAMADVFHEALKIRGSQATWVVEGEKRFDFDHPTYNDKARIYLAGWFETITLEKDIEIILDAKEEASEEASEEAFDFGVAMGPNIEGVPTADDLYDIPNKSSGSQRFKKRKKDSGLPET